MRGPERKLVFVSTPYTGDIEANVAFARQACYYAICLGHTPLAPHLLYPGIIPDAEPCWRQVGIEMGCDFLALCDEIWLCGPCVSAGMQTELDLARDIGLTVRQISSEEVLDGIKRLGACALGAQMKTRGW